MTIEPLGKRHDRSGFSCGVAALDNYLQKHALQDARKHAAVPFVATPDGKTIAGYFTLSQYAIQLDAVPEEVARKIPRYPVVPATLLGRLAVSTAFRGQRVGEFLLMDALRRSLDASRQLGSCGVVVDAKDEDAAAFYRKYGFLDFPNTRRMFLSMGTIGKLFP